MEISNHQLLTVKINFDRMSQLQIQEGAVTQGGVTAVSGRQGANYQQAVSESILQVGTCPIAGRLLRKLSPLKCLVACSIPIPYMLYVYQSLMCFALVPIL